jgi:hypothetical protein
MTMAVILMHSGNNIQFWTTLLKKLSINLWNALSRNIIMFVGMEHAWMAKKRKFFPVLARKKRISLQKQLKNKQKLKISEIGKKCPP